MSLFSSVSLVSLGRGCGRKGAFGWGLTEIGATVEEKVWSSLLGVFGHLDVANGADRFVVVHTQPGAHSNVENVSRIMPV